MHGHSEDRDARTPEAHVFATTHWSVVLAAGHDSSPDARAALEQLCRAYWYPLYAYVRRQGRGPEEAQDLVQGFFAQMFRLNSLQDVGQHKGRFRSFLLASVNHFLADAWDHARRQKRGGGVAVIPLDAITAEERYRFEPVERLDAARLFERRWALTVLDQVIARLEKEFTGRPEVFAELQRFLVGDSEKLTYASAAAALGLTETAVRTTVSRMRRRCRELVRIEIAQTLKSPKDVEEEYIALLAALRT